MSVEITVRGTAERRAAPEQVTVYLAVELEGGGRDAAFAAVSATAATLSDQLSQLAAAGPVASWSADQVRTWSERPWNQSGRQLPHVHHARAEYRATFLDFEELSRWIAANVALDGVLISHLEWTLTEAHHEDLVERARAAAVADAVAKAASYARHLGLGDIRPVAVADPGMLGADDHRTAVPMALAAMAAEGSGGVQFTPRDVTVQVAVDARFAAD